MREFRELSTYLVAMHSISFSGENSDVPKLRDVHNFTLGIFPDWAWLDF
jgi:hypothetical protein